MQKIANIICIVFTRLRSRLARNEELRSSYFPILLALVLVIMYLVRIVWKICEEYMVSDLIGLVAHNR